MSIKDKTNVKNHLRCAVITPVGPGHLETFKNYCAPSVEIASRFKKGPFDEVKHFPIYDLDGMVGRSASRNLGVKTAVENGYDWLFFLDADDIMFEDAFDAFTDFSDTYDAVWGQIVEAQSNELSSVKIRTGQVKEIDSYRDLLATDPFYSIQMGHFVKTHLAFQYPFDEKMDTGEDFNYYLKIWRSHKCIKCEKIFFLNVRGNHSTGPKSANGVQWRQFVESEIKHAVSQF